MLAKKIPSTAGCQAPRVIVNHHREHARSYRAKGSGVLTVCRWASRSSNSIGS